MARPAKCRRICRVPRVDRFVPENDIDTSVVESIQLTLDEYETIRLLDYLGMTQEECARQMDVSRTTVTAIYESARKKLADTIVNGKRLVMGGGHYQCCDGESKFCTETHRKNSVCKSNTCYKKQENIKKEEERKNMRIAVTYEPSGQIFQHFGHTEMFKVYEVENQQVVSSEVIGTNGSGHGALATLLSKYSIDILICGGIGGGAQMALAEAGIKLFGGVQGSADAAVDALLKGELLYNPNVMCNHHGHDHGNCGSHGSHGDHHCGGHCH